jgi:hypothetical protein
MFNECNDQRLDGYLLHGSPAREAYYILAENNRFDRPGGNKAFPKYVPVLQLFLMTIHVPMRNRPLGEYVCSDDHSFC